MEKEGEEMRGRGGTVIERDTEEGRGNGKEGTGVEGRAWAVKGEGY